MLAIPLRMATLEQKDYITLKRTLGAYVDVRDETLIIWSNRVGGFIDLPA